MSDTVVLFENVHPLADRAFEAAGLPIERHAAALAVSDLHDRLSGALLAGIRSRTRMDKAAFDAAPGLQALGCFCIGTNQVDLDTAGGAALDSPPCPRPGVEHVHRGTRGVRVAARPGSGGWRSHGEGRPG